MITENDLTGYEARAKNVGIGYVQIEAQNLLKLVSMARKYLELKAVNDLRCQKCKTMSKASDKRCSGCGERFL